MTVELQPPLSKQDINLEIKRLKALQNQHRNEPEIFGQYQDKIKLLTKKRDLLISNSHPGFLTGLRDKIHQAAIIFDATHKERRDID